ncbi:hypothetical protein A2631_04105 [Candidatus Daviesbacteria bacterium RIFCSPHIGHO2_01_FULL_44_29]|uniref:ABC transporter domain-containing protein n=1 Tax=Candidatus Daviesbacteria bacterium RIFCSPHIGHO2_02_FULL_43_12 TaxID=1797776 RepID=A0A1F5KG38_9BACT|nr:MAG: hypothetical protein A2631_04105 [Candidatus Daviesbacteria bacterium RIFCSPHIGHO2_01_FULL_44_29]OGE39913.1 MAG: hypothetical protein A3D25_03835 [Candidatus Daviesbacteria bacterium RIFCSPHIGHO2_02_FULL_43_12]OGE40529.1 MAG: hypothetical protein A3E86_00955 [Candidatus Daviesbacteria bacterium RIFCSPHIGHO2_12_FULL_47_45]OGE70406.1 MAG: hypothetical protein A3B55_01735 [Candidatus Daviesbacteria bacterium RIFCSPLOWO2_01_FULL_43_15]
MTDIILESITKSYDSGSRLFRRRKFSQIWALQDIDLKVSSGEFVCIVGPSGCGKSTLLKIIAGLEKPTSGEIQRPENIAMVFQSAGLLPWLTVEENVSLPLKMKGLSAKEARKQADFYLHLVGLQKFLQKLPRELSGGQRQRVGIARALSVKPDVLLLDEPFASLDTITVDDLHADLLEIWSQFKPTVIMVSHSIEEAISLSDRVIVMTENTIKKSIPIIFSRPRQVSQVGFVVAVTKIKDLIR